ncbi:hypothetical protein KC359_g8913 [Hortaea werneckii]|nr:hypothetical protein KC359_g8913 [Hortaea werneckii]
MDAVPDLTGNTISISRVKLNTMIKSYHILYELVHKCWSNFPEPPCSEKTYVFVWALASDDYCFNHGTISWERSTPNTFVHLWSIIDRIKLSLEREGLSWIVNGRNCAEYCRSTGMSGPLDAHMYTRETVPPIEITKMDEDFFPMIYSDEKGDHCSYHDFCESVKTR